MRSRFRIRLNYQSLPELSVRPEVARALRSILIETFNEEASRCPGHRASFSAQRTCGRFTRESVLIGFLRRTLVDFDRTFEVRAVIDHDLRRPQIPDHRTALLDVNPSRRVHVALHTAVYQDRKSTRLNSSHGYISYAVFCLKKKTKTH